MPEAPNDLETRRAELVRLVSRHAHADGPIETAVPGLVLVRASSPSQPLPAVYEPCLCIVVQGRKQALLGDTAYVYDPLHHLLVSMTLPIRGQIVEASPAAPYLCLRIAIDRAQVADLVPRLPAQAPAAPTALRIARTDAALLDAVARLAVLLDRPHEAEVIAPLVLREIHWRVLTGELGPWLRAICEADSVAQRLARAIDRLRSDFAMPIAVDELAAAAHMSVSTFHAHFKAATSLSPLQFQKRLRLREARRLMLAHGIDAATAAHRVGYASPSQFSRDYRRVFGAPPRREVQGLRVTDVA